MAPDVSSQSQPESQPESQPKSQPETQPSDSGSNRAGRLPFEPGNGRKKKAAEPASVTPKSASSKSSAQSPPRSSAQSSPKSSAGRAIAANPSANATPAQNKAANQQPARQGGVGKRGRDRNLTLDETRIPDIVGKRMLRRMAVFSGVPSFLGIATFFVAYGLIKYGAFEFPNEFVIAVSLLFFGLGVVGLSYGVLSASWEEDREGSLLGRDEFSLNWGRMREGWREARATKKG